VTCEAGAGRILLEQARWQPIGVALAFDDPWQVPVCVRAGNSARLETSEKCTLLTGRAGAIDFPTCVDWVMPNARAAGYYRFAMPPADLARLRDKGLAKLTTVERLAVAHNVDAAFRSGTLTGGELVQSLEAIARDAHGAIAAAPLEALGFIDAHILEGPTRTAFRARIAALYAPAVRSLGWRPVATEPPARRVFRSRLLQFLALTIEDQATLGEAAKLGRRYLGVDGDGALHPDAVDPDLAGLAIAAAARRGDAAVFDALLAHLGRTEDGQLRQRIVGALANARAQELVARSLALVLDARLRPHERVGPLWALLASVETRDAAWAWLEGNLDKLMPMLPDRYAARIPGAYAACDPGRAKALEQLFAPRADKLTGAPRSLAQALEVIAQCAARVAAHRDGIVAFAQKK
jgi:alanyl aminopeptidase